jgi:hypothetical protein
MPLKKNAQTIDLDHKIRYFMINSLKVDVFLLHKTQNIYFLNDKIAELNEDTQALLTSYDKKKNRRIIRTLRGALRCITTTTGGLNSFESLFLSQDQKALKDNFYIAYFQNKCNVTKQVVLDKYYNLSDHSEVTQNFQKIIDKKIIDKKTMNQLEFEKKTIKQLESDWDILGPLLKSDFSDYVQQCLDTGKTPNIEFFSRMS